MKNILLFVFYFWLLTITGCKKDSDLEPTPISNIPAIKFISMEPGTAIKYRDPVKITIQYTDGNGDLGENTPDVKNLYCTDSRNQVTYEFRIPQLAPDTANITITGNLVFNLSPQGFVDDNHTTETAVYSIYVTDRAGNKSNTVETTSLTINQ